MMQHLTGHKARGGGPGGVIWPCGESLAKWLASQQSGDHQFLDAEIHTALSSGSVETVLELGCGTGIVGLTLAQLGIPNVVATDGDAPSCALCQRNADCNGLPVTACELRWGDPGLTEAVMTRVGRDGNRCAEWIVCGDCVYEAQSTDDLELTLRSLIVRGGCSLVILGWCERGQQAEQFLHRLGDLGAARTVFRESSTKYAYLTRRHGKMMGGEVEFGVSLLSVHPHVTQGKVSDLNALRMLCAVRFRFGAAARCCLLAPSKCAPASVSASGHCAAPSSSQRAVERAACGHEEEEQASLTDAAGQRLVGFVQTAHHRVAVALRALRLAPGDIFVDIGCGDGRLAIAAAEEFGARAIGIDVSPALVRRCHRAAAQLGYDCSPGSRLRFLTADLASLTFEAQISDDPNADHAEARSALKQATAIYCYLLDPIMVKLTPYLLRAMARGARVMTLDYHLPMASDTEVMASLPSDCQALVHLLTPREAHLFGKIRLYGAKESLPPLRPPPSGPGVLHPSKVATMSPRVLAQRSADDGRAADDRDRGSLSLL